MRVINPAKSNEVYEFILKFKAEHDGNSPSFKDINQACGFKSVSTTSYYIDQLVERGLIKCEYEHKSRMIEVVGGQWNAPSSAPSLKRRIGNIERIEKVNNLSVIRQA